MRRFWALILILLSASGAQATNDGIPLGYQQQSLGQVRLQRNGEDLLVDLGAEGLRTRAPSWNEVQQEAQRDFERQFWCGCSETTRERIMYGVIAVYGGVAMTGVGFILYYLMI